MTSDIKSIYFCLFCDLIHWKMFKNLSLFELSSVIVLNTHVVLKLHFSEVHLFLQSMF